MDGRRKWEEMNSDCLVNIFGRLDLLSRLADVPFLCKHWNRTLSNPLCWQTLVFPKDIFKPGSIRFVVNRSQGFATTLVLPKFTAADDLIYVSDVCPNLKVLSLVSLTFSENYQDALSELIVKWKNLEILQVARCDNVVPIIRQISVHCDNFVGLAVVQSFINYEVASAIVSHIATIKYLILDGANLEKENLILILQGCKLLEQFYVRKCVGFDEDDEEIHKFASHINDFRCEGSTEDDLYFDEPLSSHDVDCDFYSD